MVSILVQPNKVTGFELGQPNSKSTLLDFCPTYTHQNIDDQLPSAKQFYDEQKNHSINPPRIEKLDPKLELLQKELEDEEDYIWLHRRRRKHSEQLTDWLFELGIKYGTIEHGNGCKCCTPPEEVKRNEEIRALKWKEICRQRKETKKLTKKEQTWLDRWNREYKQFEKWQKEWGFY